MLLLWRSSFLFFVFIIYTFSFVFIHTHTNNNYAGNSKEFVNWMPNCASKLCSFHVMCRIEWQFEFCRVSLKYHNCKDFHARNHSLPFSNGLLVDHHSKWISCNLNIPFDFGFHSIPLKCDRIQNNDFTYCLPNFVFVFVAVACVCLCGAAQNSVNVKWQSWNGNSIWMRLMCVTCFNGFL